MNNVLQSLFFCLKYIIIIKLHIVTAGMDVCALQLMSVFTSARGSKKHQLLYMVLLCVSESVSSHDMHQDVDIAALI